MFLLNFINISQLFIYRNIVTATYCVSTYSIRAVPLILHFNRALKKRSFTKYTTYLLVQLIPQFRASEPVPRVTHHTEY